MRKILTLLIPEKFLYADHLTASAQRLFMRLAVALPVLVGSAVAIGLLTSGNWNDVLAGALFAWSTSVAVWAIGSYRAKTEETSLELRHMAELDLLHSRLNHVANKVGLPLLDLSGEIDIVLRSREERLAHFEGLDEFRSTSTQAETEWWDPIALGVPLDPDVGYIRPPNAD